MTPAVIWQGWKILQVYLDVYENEKYVPKSRGLKVFSPPGPSWSSAEALSRQKSCMASSSSGSDGCRGKLGVMHVT